MPELSTNAPQETGGRFQNFMNRLFDPGPITEQNVAHNRQLGDLMLAQVSRPRVI